MHRALLLEIKVSTSVWAGFGCADYSLALYFAYSHMVLLTKHRAAPLWGRSFVCVSLISWYLPANKGLVPDFVFPWLLIVLFPNPVLNILSG